VAEQNLNKEQLSPAPYISSKFNTRKMMGITLISLLLPVIGAIVRYGYNALGLIIVTVASAIVAGMICRKLRGQPLIFDVGTIITGLLLALVLPPGLPLWIAAIGSFFAICIVKEAFGGAGQNIFNPTLGAQAFLLASFAGPMGTWIEPAGFGGELINSINPLAGEISAEIGNFELYQSLLFGSSAGYLGGSALLVLLGGLILVLVRAIDFKVPVAYLVTVIITSLIFGADPIFHLLAGGVMFTAFYFACDPVTTPMYWKGRIVFAVGAGILTVLIRQYGNAIDGTVYAILIMNAVVPLIDRYIKPIPFGTKKAKSSAT